MRQGNRLERLRGERGALDTKPPHEGAAKRWIDRQPARGHALPYRSASGAERAVPGIAEDRAAPGAWLTHSRYWARKPPSTASVCPVIIAAPGLAKKVMACATSSGSARRPRGVTS